MLRSRRLTTVAVAVTAGAVLAAGLVAAGPASAAPDAELAEDLSTSLLVLPEEMTGTQFTAEDIARQQAALDSLTSAQHKQQNDLRLREARFTAGPAEYHLPAPLRASPLSGRSTAVTPMIVGRDCTTSSNWYRLKYRTNGPFPSNLQYCVAGAGTWYIDPYLPDVRSLRAGAQRGRTLYRPGADGELYWSLWRGPNDWNEYEFNILGPSIRVYRIEISQGPT